MRRATRGRSDRPLRPTPPRARQTASERLVALAQQVAGEVDGLREQLDQALQDKARLTAEMREGTDILERAVRDVRTRRTPVATQNGHAMEEDRAPRERRRVRSTPAHIGPELVRDTLQRFGRPVTAAELAAEISRSGDPVSGRAIRHIARTAGATIHEGPDGRQLYSIA
jgi:hypothetical protein